MGMSYSVIDGLVIIINNYDKLFHDLLLSPISQRSDCSELTCHNSLH